jgi:hypothetical protein
MATLRPASAESHAYLAVWLLLRVQTTLFAALFSGLHPITVLERTVAAWPPAGALAIWLHRVFIEPWLRWDAIWYAGILTGGYAPGNGSTAFHPVYVLLSRPLYRLGMEPALSLLITSSLASLGFFWVFYKFARLDLAPEGTRLSIALLASFPLAIILFAPYSESVFLLFATVALYEMRLRRWVPAAFATCLAALSRQQGVLLALPMLWYAWEDSGRSLRGIGKAWQPCLAALGAPLGLLSWAIYRIGYLHEGTLNGSSWQAFIYSGLLSSSAKSIIPYQTVMWPWKALVLTLEGLMNRPDVEDVMNMALAAGFCVLLAIAWRNMKPADRIYSLAIVLVGFSVYTGQYRLYLSLPRHLLLAVPVFVGLAASLKRRWHIALLIGVQGVTQVFMLFLYVNKAWIP